MELQQLWAQIGSYALTGAIVSAVIQVTKGWLEKRTYKILWTAALCVGFGAGTYLLGLLPGGAVTVVAGIFASANTFYALFFKK